MNSGRNDPGDQARNLHVDTSDKDSAHHTDADASSRQIIRKKRVPASQMDMGQRLDYAVISQSRSLINSTCSVRQWSTTNSNFTPIPSLTSA